MEGWEASLFLQAQAEIIIVEGMKAENAKRESLGEAQAYTEQNFYDCATEIEKISRLFLTS